MRWHEREAIALLYMRNPVCIGKGEEIDVILKGRLCQSIVGEPASAGPCSLERQFHTLPTRGVYVLKKAEHPTLRLVAKQNVIF